MAKRSITITINDYEYRGEAEARKLLIDFIREDLGLTGTHAGCEHGVCGACTILMDAELVRSCLLFAVQADGARLRTVEGMANGKELHPIQDTFWKHHALQCGFCTPGILISAEVLLKEKPRPTEYEIREWLSGHLCRCTGYQNIVTAIKEAAERVDHNRE